MTETIHETNGLEHLPAGVTKEGLLDIVRQVREAKAQPSDGEKIGAISEARKRLEKLKHNSRPVIELFDYEGELFHVRRLNYQQLIELAVSVQRDGYNVLQISDESGARAVTVAVLISCICNEDGTPFFSREDVEDYMDSPDAAALVSALFRAANEYNPDIFSTLKKS